MPKAKPDQVVVHRVELQEKEREMLENYILFNGGIRAIGAVGSVVGPAMAAVAGPLVGWYIAQWTIDDYKEWLDTRVEGVRNLYANPAINVYNDLCAVFQSASWSTFENIDLYMMLQDSVEAELGQYDNPYWDEWIRELKQRARLFMVNFNGPEGAGRRRIAQSQNWNVVTAWQNWYPQDEMVNDVIYSRKTGGLVSNMTLIFDFLTSPFRE